MVVRRQPDGTVGTATTVADESAPTPQHRRWLAITLERWLFAGLLLLRTSCAPASETSEASPLDVRELIRDRHFLRGFEVYSPEPGKKVVTGKLQWEGCLGEPVWGLAQWHSRTSLAGAEPERLPSGAIRFANEAKEVIVGPPGTADAGLTLAVDSRCEYPDGLRRKGEMWTHLLASQQFRRCPSLAEMAELRFRISARLLRSRRFEGEAYSRNLHAAQFQTTITVQNLNRQSPGYGDFIWFNVPHYDDRWPIPRAFVAPDQALKRMIYTPPGELLSDRSTHDGDWVALDVDLLPIMKDALNAAWERGFVSDSRDLADYRLGGLSIGWEVPGTFDVTLQIRDVSLKVRTH
jgi:hypothetical protein